MSSSSRNLRANPKPSSLRVESTSNPGASKPKAPPKKPSSQVVVLDDHEATSSTRPDEENPPVPSTDLDDMGGHLSEPSSLHVGPNPEPSSGTLPSENSVSRSSQPPRHRLVPITADTSEFEDDDLDLVSINSVNEEPPPPQSQALARQRSRRHAPPTRKV